MRTACCYSVSMARLRRSHAFDSPISGLGWLPDGRLLVVSMHDRRLLRRDADGVFRVHADLSDVATWHANDMVVDRNGVAYVGNFGCFRSHRSVKRPGQPIWRGSRQTAVSVLQRASFGFRTAR